MPSEGLHLYLMVVLVLKMGIVEANVINFAEVEEIESKLNRILDSEVKEKTILEKLSSFSLNNNNRGQSSSSSSGEKGAGRNRENSGILDDLVETTGRMEWLVGLLADMKTMLNQAIDSQQKQLSLQTEVGELRDEINYLREEVQILKQNQVKSESFHLNTKVQTKLENDEKKIEWLTMGLEEIRHEVREISSSFNVTTLFHLTEKAENEGRTTKRNLDTFQKDLKKLEVAQTQTTQDIVEIKGDVADMRRKEADLSLNLGTSILKSRVQRSEGPLELFRKRVKRFRSQNPQRHQKRKVRSELNILGTTVDGILSWTAELEQRLDAFETTTSQHSSNSELNSGTSELNSGTSELSSGTSKPSSRTSEPSSRTSEPSLRTSEPSSRTSEPSLRTSEPGSRTSEPSSSTSQPSPSANLSPDDLTKNEGHLVLDDIDYTRLISLETSLAETQNHLSEMKAEVAVVGELRDSTQTLFKVLEALETKYDGRMTEFQDKLSHLDVLTNVVTITQDEIKEQQTAQWKTTRKYKLKVQDTEKRFEETHLRVTALQAHILQWGMKTCANELKEKRQDLKILALEKVLGQQEF